MRGLEKCLGLSCGGETNAVVAIVEVGVVVTNEDISHDDDTSHAAACEVGCLETAHTLGLTLVSQLEHVVRCGELVVSSVDDKRDGWELVNVAAVAVDLSNLVEDWGDVGRVANDETGTGVDNTLDSGEAHVLSVNSHVINADFPVGVGDQVVVRKA
jgi:hypothetical protein